MSRKHKSSQDGRYHVGYGYDRCCGYFLQVFDTTQSDEEDEGLIFEVDELERDLQPRELVHYALNYGVELWTHELEALRAQVTSDPEQRRFAIQLSHPRMCEINSRET